MSKIDVFNGQQNIFVKGNATCLPALKCGLLAMKSTISSDIYFKSVELEPKLPAQIAKEKPSCAQSKPFKKCVGNHNLVSYLKNNPSCEAANATEKIKIVKKLRPRSLVAITNKQTSPNADDSELKVNDSKIILHDKRKWKRKKSRLSQRKVKSAESNNKKKPRKKNKIVALSQKQDIQDKLFLPVKKNATFLSKEYIPKFVKQDGMNCDKVTLPPNLVGTNVNIVDNRSKRNLTNKTTGTGLFMQENQLLPTRIQLIHKFGNENLLHQHMENEKQRRLSMKYKQKHTEMQYIEMQKQIQRAQIYALNQLMTQFENMQVKGESSAKV